MASVAWVALHQLELMHQLQPFLDRATLALDTHALVSGNSNALYVGLALMVV